jgi:hypothetical protein
MRALTVALFFLSISFSVSAQNYPLEVEAHQVHSATEGLASLDGMTTFRIYVTNLGATDFVSAVYGNDISPFELSVPDGIHNSAFNTGWSASGLQPNFISIFPEMEYDSYATIGLTESASTSGISGAADPSLVQDPAQPFSPMFLTDGSVGGMVNTVTGFAYYLFNDGINTAGLPDEDGRVLIMQITTSGTLSGTLNVHIFPNGEEASLFTSTYMFDGAGLFTTSNYGCVFSVACNYNPEAIFDDGSCDFVDSDGDGVCDASEMTGCTDLTACNYEITATDDDGSCDFVDTDGDGVCDVSEISGCMDATACNYDLLATDDDGTCTYAGTYDCSGECVNDNDDDGVCDELEILGCTDQGSCNFDLQATDDDGSCEYITCAGCQYEFACNYDSEATIADNTSCEFGTCPGCTDPTACNYNPTVLEDDGSCGVLDACGVCLGSCPGCISDFDFGDVGFGVSPDPSLGESFVSGVVGQEYYDILHILMPTFASDIDDAYPPPLPIDSIGFISVVLTNTITLMEYSPAELGLEFVCNNNGDSPDPCMFMGGVQYCPSIEGTPNIPGEFTIDFLMLGWLTIFEPFSAEFVFSNFILNIEDDGNCLYIDECGICGGSGIPEGDCDCDGNMLDECGSCGGSGIPEGDCDCDGNVLDECGTCGGSGIPEGDCDCDGNVLDECGSCGGSGISDCDCDGNVLDACGVCGGDGSSCGFTGYTVELDTMFLEEGSDLEFFGTYRVYANFTNPNDAISALYSDVGALGTPPMYIDAPCGCHNPVDGNAAMDASNSSAFWSTFPEWEYDTYWTIGMPSGDAPGLLPSSIGMPDGDVICSGSTNDGALYVLGLPPNALAGEDLRVLIAQVTTCGDWSLQTCFHTSVNADQTNMVQSCPEILEVTHPYLDGECVNDSDSDGVCDEFEIAGCFEPEACNYNPDATEDEGSCDYSCCPGPGCCNAGTIWDVESQTCIVLYPSDSNFDGCVDLNDLLDLLVDYGICVEPE